jgi:predicted component of type VI protein secretion system
MSEASTLDAPRVKPFSKNFVILATLKHVRRSIDISISKTFDRVKDFDGQPDKATEVMETLSELHQMRKSIEDLERSITKGNS